MRATALVVAAGSSTRMGADKLWADLGGRSEANLATASPADVIGGRLSRAA